MNDANFALNVRERNLSSLDEALTVSLRLEAWIRDTNRQEYDEPTGGKMRVKDIGSTVVADNSTEISAIKTQVNSLGKQISELCQSLKNTDVQQTVAVPPH